MTRHHSEHVPWSEILVPAHIPALALITLGVSLHAANSLLVATMLPAIVAEIGGERWVSWTVALYESGTVIMATSSAYLALRFGLRMPMSMAAALFAFGCIVSASAPTMPVLLIGRTLQGLGGGGMMALSFVAVAALFPTRLSARALAVISTFWGVSAFLGPLIGGLFVAYASWRAGFLTFAALATVLSLWVAFRLEISESRDALKVSGSVPILRLMILALGVVLVAYGGVDITPLRTPVFIVAGLACLTAFVVIDGRHMQDRLLPSGALNLKTPQGAALVMILSFSVATIGILAYGPLLVTRIHGVSALIAGYIAACSSIGWTVAAVLVSGAPERNDPKLIATGMVVVTLSIFGFIWSIPNGPVWLIAVFSFIEGAGFGMSWTFILRRATALTDTSESERVAGAIPTIQRLGYALGAAFIGILANAAGLPAAESDADLNVAAIVMFVGCLPIAAIGLIAMMSFVTRPGLAKIRSGDGGFCS